MCLTKLSTNFRITYCLHCDWINKEKSIVLGHCITLFGHIAIMMTSCFDTTSLYKWNRLNFPLNSLLRPLSQFRECNGYLSVNPVNYWVWFGFLSSANESRVHTSSSPWHSDGSRIPCAMPRRCGRRADRASPKNTEVMYCDLNLAPNGM